MICVSDLTKTYSRKVAVDDISFEIPSGQIVGSLGPNGAGKSTTVKMLVGILQPTRGNIVVAGCDSSRDPIELKRHIGYVPESASLYETLTPVEYLQLVGQLYHLPENSIAEKIDEFVELFYLTRVAHQPIRSLSKGMKQKVVLISAMLHNPDVLFLDEPVGIPYFTFLSQINPVSVWYLIVLSRGVAVVADISRQKTEWLVALIWLAGIGVQVVISAL